MSRMGLQRWIPAGLHRELRWEGWGSDCRSLLLFTTKLITTIRSKNIIMILEILKSIVSTSNYFYFCFYIFYWLWLVFFLSSWLLTPGPRAKAEAQGWAQGAGTRASLELSCLWDPPVFGAIWKRYPKLWPFQAWNLAANARNLVSQPFYGEIWDRMGRIWVTMWYWFVWRMPPVAAILDRKAFKRHNW